jgi:hypothetical protein
MEKIFLGLWIITILLLIFISLLLLKIIKKLYKKELAITAKEKSERRAIHQQRRIEERERHKIWYEFNYFTRVIFHLKFVPGFNLEKVAILEEND